MEIKFSTIQCIFIPQMHNKRLSKTLSQAFHLRGGLSSFIYRKMLIIQSERFKIIYIQSSTGYWLAVFKVYGV